MSYHLMAMPIRTSPKNVYFDGNVRAPSIIHSGTPEACWARAGEICGGRNMNDLVACINGASVFWTPDWAYYIVAD